MQCSSWWMKTGLDGGDWWLQLSNTHLQEIAIERGIPSYHIDSAERIRPGNRVEHRLLSGNLQVTENWLPEGGHSWHHIRASTPDKVVADVVEKIF